MQYGHIYPILDHLSAVPLQSVVMILAHILKYVKGNMKLVYFNSDYLELGKK